MKKQFYSDIVDTNSILIELEALDISSKEKKHLLTIAHESIHLTVLDTVLSSLEEKDKEVFLKHLERSDHTKTWEFLKSKTVSLEEKIKKQAEKLKKELQKDIAELKSQK